MSGASSRTFPKLTETAPPRELIGISELDSRLQDEIGQCGNPKLFRITMWREPPDRTGCNWNARVDRIEGGESDDTSWWDAVPRLRERFNLA